MMTGKFPSHLSSYLRRNLMVHSLRCLAVLGSVLGRAGQQGQRRRLEDAKNGVVEWETPLEIQQWMAIQRKHAEWTQRAEQEKAAAEAAPILERDA